VRRVYVDTRRKEAVLIVGPDAEVTGENVRSALQAVDHTGTLVAP
jgi:hypothetical protein